jgi:hypothetical protein
MASTKERLAALREYLAGLTAAANFTHSRTRFHTSTTTAQLHRTGGESCFTLILSRAWTACPCHSTN